MKKDDKLFSDFCGLEDLKPPIPHILFGISGPPQAAGGARPARLPSLGLKKSLHLQHFLALRHVTLYHLTRSPVRVRFLGVVGAAFGSSSPAFSKK
jgi:hypothetical protein